jgi:PAS domain S-box-containing protein
MSEDENSRQPASDGSKAPVASDEFPRKLDDISDRVALQRLQDAFVHLTGVGAVMVDAEGHPWTAPSEAWRPIFGESGDVEAYRQVGLRARDAGTYVLRERGDGTYEACAPVFLGGLHLGSWLCGPVRVLSELDQADGDAPVPAMTMDAFARLVTFLDEVARVQSSHGHRLAELRSWCVSRRHLERHLNSVLNALADPVFVKDEQHRWVTLNDAFCSFMGRPREELLGKSDFDVFPEEEALEFWRVDDEVLRSGEAVTNEERLTDASGTTHVISTKKTMFIADEGKRYLVGVIRDITARHKVEEELSRHREHLEELVAERTLALSSANRMLQLEIDERRRAEAEKREMQAQIVHQQKIEAIGRLAGGIAHDFNNLLTGVFGHVTLALRDDTMDPKARDSLLQVREAATRAADLTKQLLAFSRKQIIEPRVVDLNKLIDNLRRLLDRIIGEDVQLVTRYDSRLGSVRVDPVQIEQVIVNLAVNARDAMPGGGTLRIETMNRRIRDVGLRAQDSPPPGDYAVLVVSDTGIGMDDETQARLFEPFFTTKPKGQGTGLGLATAYGIIKQHRGAILVTSTPGQGSVFQVLLPCVDVPSDPASAPPPQQVTGGSETILLVEDEEIVRHATQGMLEHLGYHVISAHDGVSALRASEAFRGTIHLLMTDVVMPSMNGKELAELLLRIRPDMRVLFTSGYTDDVIVHHGVLETGVSFVSKPFDTAELARRVRKALER